MLAAVFNTVQRRMTPKAFNVDETNYICSACLVCAVCEPDSFVSDKVVHIVVNTLFKSICLFILIVEVCKH